MMSRTFTFVAVAALLTAAGCDRSSEANSESKPAPAAKSVPTAPATPAAALGSSLAEAGGKYTIDSAHTQALFKILHLGASYQYGMFTRVEGTFSIDAANLANSEIDIKIPTASLFTAVKKRDDHLRSPDFFDAKQFPEIRFQSKSVEATGANTYSVVGDLTMHGVTKPVTLSLEHVGSGKDPEMMGGAFRTGFNGQARIERSDWNMTYMQGAGLGDEVTLLLSVEGTRN